jgi:hypothetical protein
MSSRQGRCWQSGDWLGLYWSAEHRVHPAVRALNRVDGAPTVRILRIRNRARILKRKLPKSGGASRWKPEGNRAVRLLTVGGHLEGAQADYLRKSW